MNQLVLAVSIAAFCLVLYVPSYIHNFLMRKSRLHGFEEEFSQLVSEVKQDYRHGQLHKNPFILIGLYKKSGKAKINDLL